MHCIHIPRTASSCRAQIACIVHIVHVILLFSYIVHVILLFSWPQVPALCCKASCITRCAVTVLSSTCSSSVFEWCGTARKLIAQRQGYRCVDSSQNSAVTRQRVSHDLMKAKSKGQERVTVPSKVSAFCSCDQGTQLLRATSSG
jgi:hypothetical protein